MLNETVADDSTVNLLVSRRQVCSCPVWMEVLQASEGGSSWQPLDFVRRWLDVGIILLASRHISMVWLVHLKAADGM